MQYPLVESKMIKPLDILNERKKSISDCYNNIASQRNKWIEKNRYYYNYVKKILNFIVEPQSSVLQIKCETGYFLNAVNPKYGLGVDCSAKMVEIAKNNYPHLDFEVQDLENINTTQRFDYILLINALGDVVDIQKMLNRIKFIADSKTRIVIINYNHLWQPIINLAALLKLKMNQPTQNWLSLNDIDNLLHLTGFESVKKTNFILFHKYIPFFSNFLNNIIARLPIIQKLCFNHAIIARKNISRHNYSDFSVSVIIPCKNERGNVLNAVDRIPEMGKFTEIIFCDDRSDDGTAEEVLKVMGQYPNKNIKLICGPGINKARNVWAGFEKAHGDILMILDADLAVIPEELPYFFEAIVEGKGEFINGSRMIYPMQEDAMRSFNILGNKLFSLLFSYLLGQRIKDTLCGTKVLWRNDYYRIKNHIGCWGVEDLWGDYDLLFGATKLNLKIIDLPVHYFERIYGETKMKKVIYNGLRMLRIYLAALEKLKFV